jgi:hypothetical protein
MFQMDNIVSQDNDGSILSSKWPWILRQQITSKRWYLSTHGITFWKTVFLIFFFCFTGPTTLCGYWPTPWFRNSKLFRGGGGVLAPCPTPNLEDQGLHFVWPLPFDLLALPGAYAPASISLRVIGVRMPPLQDKAVYYWPPWIPGKLYLKLQFENVSIWWIFNKTQWKKSYSCNVRFLMQLVLQQYICKYSCILDCYILQVL